MRPRRRWREAALVGLVLTGACAYSGPPLPTQGDQFFVAGYHPYWAGDVWQTYPFDALDRLYFFEVEASPDGGLRDRHGWPEQWLPLIEWASTTGVDLVPTISMHTAEGFEELFASPANNTLQLEEALDLLLATPGLGGLHLDFEVFSPVSPDVRDGYTDFVAELRQRMSETDGVFTLSSFALAFDDDDVYAEEALAEVVDYLVVQGYDFHSAGEPSTGPVAALSGWGRLNWESVVDRFIGFGVPPRKIVMAVPMYGYQWPSETDQPGSVTRGSAVEVLLAPPPDVLPELPRARDQVTLHGVRRDPESDIPYYAFQDATGWHQGWFEDAESLRAKYAFVRERGLGGVALFPLAYGDAAIWGDLREAFRRPRE
jgi:spore germination protein YaaH